MTTEITYPQYLETADNLKEFDKFVSLLNFWHISKINKEREYIKRHGLHPVLRDFETKSPYGSTYNSFSIDGSSDINKLVFTVFRIYLEKQFPSFEVSKVRDVKTWVLTLDNNSFGLDNPFYLQIAALKLLNRDNFEAITIQDLTQNRSWNRNNMANKFSIKYTGEINELMVNRVEKDIEAISSTLQREIDPMIKASLDRLMNNGTFLENLGIDIKAKPKKKSSKAHTDETLAIIEEGIINNIPPQRNPVVSEGINRLVELNTMLGNSITNLSMQDRFSFLSNYLRMANPENQQVPTLTPVNLQAFENALRNAA